MAGYPLVYGISATGSEPMTYQWFHSGTPIPGATHDTLRIPAVTLANAGEYSVHVANSAGDARTAPAVLTIVPAGIRYRWSTLAGRPGTDGRSDGTGTNALFSAPSGIAVDAEGKIWVADASTDFLRQVTTNGVVTTFRDASGRRVSIPTPVDVGIHPDGSVLVQSLNSRTIRIFGVGLLAVLPGGGWGTGTGPSGTVYQGSIARVVGIHPDATLQQWARPIVEAVQVLERVDRSLLIADSPANVVRQIAPDGSKSRP